MYQDFFSVTTYHRQRRVQLDVLAGEHAGDRAFLPIDEFFLFLVLGVPVSFLLRPIYIIYVYMRMAVYVCTYVCTF